MTTLTGATLADNDGTRDAVYFGTDGDPAAIEVGTFDRVPTYTPGIKITENSTVPIRRSFFSPVLEQGLYELRIKRITPDTDALNIQDDVYITDVNEIVLDDVSYINTALVAVKVQLDEQLNGMPTITYVNGGRVIRTFNAAENIWEDKASSNPAWICLDALTHPRYGASMPIARFDIEMFKQWAAYCDEGKLTFDAVIDTASNIWDVLQPVLRCGHAQIINVGTRFTVVIERPAEATMMFGVGNIIQGSFKQNWLGIADRANEIEVTFYDKADNYKQRQVRVVDRESAERGENQRPSSITLLGVVDLPRAYKEGFFQLNLNKYILQTVEFSAPIESIACSVGDLIYVQHDMPLWGYAGRLGEGSTESVIKLDREVPMEDGRQYKLLVKLDTVRRATGYVQSVIGNSITVSGWDGEGVVKRITTTSGDRGVLSKFNPGTGPGIYGLILDNPIFGDSAGSIYELWDTDVIEERDVVVEPGSATTLTAMSPFSQAPEAYVNWMFGAVDKVKKPFRVRMISGTHEYKRDISCVEYNASCYDFSGMAVPTNNYSDLDLVVRQVTIDGTKETSVASGNGYITSVTVGFHSTAESYASSTVKLSVNNGPFQVLSTLAKAQATTTAQLGDNLVFKVIAMDALGAFANEAKAPTYRHVVRGRGRPGEVTGFKSTFTAEGVLLSWDAPPNIDWQSTEVRIGASWGTGVTLFSGRDTSVMLPLETQPNTKSYWARHTIPLVQAITDVTLVVETKAPAKVEFTVASQRGGSVSLNWPGSKVSQPIGSYVIRIGDSSIPVEDLPNAAFVGGTTLTHTIVSEEIGQKRIWMAAIDFGGIISPINFFDLLVRDDAQPDLTVPDSPINFDVDSAITNLFFSTNTAAFTQGHGYSHTQIYGIRYVSGPLPVFANAMKLTTFIGSSGSYPTPPATTWRLWATWVSNDGVESLPAGGLNGLTTTSGIDVTVTIDTLEADIEATDLYKDLGKRVDLIDGPEELAGSVAARIAAEAALRIRAIKANADDILRLAVTQHKETLDRIKDTAVAIQGVETKIVNGVSAEASANLLLAAKINQNGALITEERDARADADEALVQAIDSLSVNFGPNIFALIRNEEIARTTAIEAEANTRQTLASQFRGDYEGNELGELSEGLLYQERNTRATANEATAEQITLLTASLGQNKAAVLYEASVRASADAAEAIARSTLGTQVADNSALIEEEQTVRATADEAEATARQALAIIVGANSVAIVNEIIARANADLAEATARQALQVQVQANAASIINEQTVRANAISAEAAARQLLIVEVASAKAAILTEQQTRASQDQAIATSIQTLNSTLNGVTAGLSVSASTTNSGLNGLAAQYTVKVDLNGYVSGYGLASTAINDVAQSAFAIRADRFYIASPSGAGVAPSMPFIVLTTPQTINGAVIQPGVYMKEAFIANATITNAKIANAAIDSAKIKSLSVETLNIAGNAVTVPGFIEARSRDVTLNYVLSGELGAYYSVFIIGSLVQSWYSTISLFVNGALQWSETPVGGTLATRGLQVYLQPGTHTIRLVSSDTRNANSTSIYVLATKK